MSKKEGNNGELYGFGKIGVTKTSSKSEISLWMDMYNDMFSDFDPRPYSQRALSQDFLEELRRATKETDNASFKLKLLIPSGLRKLDEENVIKRRLKDHFKKHAVQLHKEESWIVKKGIIVTVFGFILMLGAALLHYLGGNHILWSLLTVLAEPGGWFMMWFGLDHIFYLAKAKNPEHVFYDKMAIAEIKFDSY